MENTYPQYPIVNIKFIYELTDVGKGIIPVLEAQNLTLIYTDIYIPDTPSWQQTLERGSSLYGSVVIESYQSNFKHYATVNESYNSNYNRGFYIINGSDETVFNNKDLVGIGTETYNEVLNKGIFFSKVKSRIVDNYTQKGLENEGDYEANFTSRSLVTKQYVDNRTVNSTSPTALNKSQLNTLYPLATIGFKVQCLSITSGALMYEKTSNGWVQYGLQIVL